MYGHRPSINLPSNQNAASAQLGTGVEDADTSNWRAPRCPDCGSGLIRVRRRPADRLLSAIVPVRRFRCSGMQCGYEGNVAKTAIRKRHAWLALACYLMAMIAGVPLILGASYLTAPKPAVPEDSQVNGSPTGDAPQTSSRAAPLAFVSSHSLTRLSEPSLALSPGTRPTDSEPGLLNYAGPDHRAGMGSADATNTQGLTGGGAGGREIVVPRRREQLSLLYLDQRPDLADGWKRGRRANGNQPSQGLATRRVSNRLGYSRAAVADKAD